MGNGYTTTFPLKFFTQTNSVADYIRLKLNFFSKKRIAFKPPFGGFRDNVHTPSIAHWKARSRLNIRSALFGFITKHACHRRTDERTELRLPRPR